MKNSRHRPSSFLIVFPMVNTESLQLYWMRWNTGTISSESWELLDIDVRIIDSGTFRRCLGVIRKSLEWFWMLMDDRGWFSENAISSFHWCQIVSLVIPDALAHLLTCPGSFSRSLISVDFWWILLCSRARKVLRTPSHQQDECPKFTAGCT